MRASGADSTMTMFQENGCRRFDRTVLNCYSSVHRLRDKFGLATPLKRKLKLTRQTTFPHLLHSFTISLAQVPTLPTSLTSLPCSTKYQSAARARYRKVCSGFGSTFSFSQCSVQVRSCERYCSRLARIWRQEIDRESRSLRSRWEDKEMTILLGKLLTTIVVNHKRRNDV